VPHADGHRPLLEPTARSQASAASRQRLELARNITSLCPTSFAREIAVTGSTSRGVANSRSDLELNLWSDLSPSDRLPAWLDLNLRWLKEAGQAKNFYVDQTPIADGSFWATCRIRGIWVEIGWQQLDIQASWVDRLLSGNIVAHSLLTMADALIHAVPVRTTGALAKWKAALSEYPPALQERLIRDAIDSWTFPLHIEMSWKASGEHRLKYFEHLLADIHGVLRLVFAVNRIWEPDWKRLRRRVSSAMIKPTRMVSRITGILHELDPFEARAECYKLILETLALVPGRFDGSRASEILTSSLMKHTNSHRVP